MENDFIPIEWDEATIHDCRQLVRLWVHEDLGRGHDWTTLALVSEDQRGKASLVTRESGVLCGVRACEIALDEMDVSARWDSVCDDGTRVTKNMVVAEIEGPARDLLTTERLLLNLLGRLSGVATNTQRYVDAISDFPTMVYDTRKTTPGWRRLEKYAVRCGGGCNHRSGLFDAILIKDNHLACASGARSSHDPTLFGIHQVREFLLQTDHFDMRRDMIVEVEVDNLEQLRSILPATPDIVLLDNMVPADLCRAVEMRNALNANVQLEASGGVQLETIDRIAATGVDRISVGALTHSAVNFDIGMDWQT